MQACTVPAALVAQLLALTIVNYQAAVYRLSLLVALLELAHGTRRPRVQAA